MDKKKDKLWKKLCEDLNVIDKKIQRLLKKRNIIWEQWEEDKVSLTKAHTNNVTKEH